MNVFYERKLDDNGNFLDLVFSLIREVLSLVERFACEGRGAPEGLLIPVALYEEDNCQMTFPIDNSSMWPGRQGRCESGRDRGRH